jgi:protein-S-isoprenylcysteine O-methyltransferase Ste14
LREIVTLFRHLFAILLLPFVMVVLVPRWILRAWSAWDTRWIGGTVAAVLGHVAGIVLFLLGLALFTWCVSLFARIGQGTLAPWDPTHRLVAVGPYQYIRNPMITAVLTMLVGEALHHGSRVVAVWAMTFLAFNHIYFILVEEPGLERRFGAAYAEYKAAVPRWVPRSTPWRASDG